MGTTENLSEQEGIQKLKELVAEITVCLFCTDLKKDDGSNCRPMGAQKVCDQGNIWFFNDVNSDKNKQIKQDKHVQLFFAHPGKDSYLVVNGDAEIIIDRKKNEELWTPLLKTWFKEGKDDPNISIIKVIPRNAYYWDTDGNKMINFFKMIGSIATGTTLDIGKQGVINT